jgi:uncharacterized protein YbjT (DUF2867 family)
MRVLVTGGSGVIGEGLIPQLLERGHQVRLLTRGASSAASEWPDTVESFAADVTRPEQLVGAAKDCDAVVHISGIVAEDPPDYTFARVNVAGTQHLLAECARQGLPRFVFISSLAAERGASAYHASKREAEALVRTYAGAWIILRPGNVYGPGDDVISQLLTMHRTLPVVPLIGSGDHRFQPIWYKDLGKAIARALDPDIAQGTYAVAGDQVTTPHEILSRLQMITGRTAPEVPVPEFLADLTSRIADASGLPFPINESQFQMLIEENVVREPDGNALTRVFGVRATALADALAALVDIQPEQTPQDGVGGMEKKRFWADISQPRVSPEELMDEFRLHCTELIPIAFDAEPNTPQEVVEGVTLTAALPLRGNIQVRVVESTARAVTFATLRGHPLAGVVRFTTGETGPGILRFTVSVYGRAATIMDWLAMSTVGGAAQNSTWRTVVERMIEVSGGVADGVHEERTTVHGVEEQAIAAFVEELVRHHRRVVHERV